MDWVLADGLSLKSFIVRSGSTCLLSAHLRRARRLSRGSADRRTACFHCAGTCESESFLEAEKDDAATEDKAEEAAEPKRRRRRGIF